MLVDCTIDVRGSENWMRHEISKKKLLALGFNNLVFISTRTSPSYHHHIWRVKCKPEDLTILKLSFLKVSTAHNDRLVAAILEKEQHIGKLQQDIDDFKNELGEI